MEATQHIQKGRRSCCPYWYCLRRRRSRHNNTTRPSHRALGPHLAHVAGRAILHHAVASCQVDKLFQQAHSGGRAAGAGRGEGRSRAGELAHSTSHTARREPARLPLPPLAYLTTIVAAVAMGRSFGILYQCSSCRGGWGGGAGKQVGCGWQRREAGQGREEEEEEGWNRQRLGCSGSHLRKLLSLPSSHERRHGCARCPARAPAARRGHPAACASPAGGRDGAVLR